MEKTFTKAEEFGEHLKEYLNNRISSVKLRTAEKSSAIIANFISKAITFLVFVFFIALVSVSLKLGNMMGEMYFGFLIVTGIYLLLGIVIWVSRERILEIPIMDAMLRQLFKTTEDEED